MNKELHSIVRMASKEGPEKRPHGGAVMGFVRMPENSKTQQSRTFVRNKWEGSTSLLFFQG
jgi:hypothetical protein